jgi:hypothetical protein
MTIDARFFIFEDRGGCDGAGGFQDLPLRRLAAKSLILIFPYGMGKMCCKHGA